LLPNFLVVGAAKAWTTSLYQLFKRHKEVFVSKKKELNYFSLEYKYKNIGDYEEYFKGSEDFVAVIEVSPSYFYVQGTARRIFQVVPNIKLLILLRNPIERFYSDYKYSQVFGYNIKGLNEDFYSLTPNHAIETQYTDWSDPIIMLKKGLYSVFLKEYLQYFSRSNIKIILFDDFIKNYENVILSIQKFINVTPIKFDNITANSGGVPRSDFIFNLLKKRNSAKIIGGDRTERIKNWILRKNIKKSKTEINLDLKIFLIQFYKQDILELQDILQISLKHWTEDYNFLS